MSGGLQPVNKIGVADGGQVNAYKAKNGLTRNLYAGAPVRVSGGYVKDVTANTQTPLGVFQQGAYIDSNGVPKWSQAILSGTSSNGGSIDGIPTSFGIPVWVYDDPNQEYVIQANASVPASGLGAYAQVSVTGGSSFTGRSNARLDYSAAGTSLTNAMFRIVGCPNFPNNVGYGVSAGNTPDGSPINQWDVANTYVQVVFAKQLLGFRAS